MANMMNDTIGRGLAISRRMLRALGNSGDRDKPPGATWTGGGTRSPKGDARTQAAFLRRLERICLDSPAPVSGRVHLIQLTRLRKHLGGRWPEVAERVHTIVEQAIGRALSPTDLHLRVDEDCHVVAFTALAPREAQIKSGLIAERIARRAVGIDAQPGLVEVKTAVRGEDGRFQLLRSNLHESLEQSFCAPPPAHVFAPALYDDPTEAWQLPSFLTTPVFRPVWNVKREAVSTFLYGEAVELPNGVLVLRDERGAANDPRVTFSRDYQALRQATERQARLIEGGGAAIVTVPIHYETLASMRTRLSFIRACEKVPDPQRRWVGFYLVNVPPGVPPARLRDLVSGLKPYCRSVGAHAPLDLADFSRFVGAGLHSIGCSVQPRDQDEASVVRSLRRFVERANLAGLRTFVSGLNSRDLALAAADAGADYATGNAIAPLVHALEEIYRLTRADVTAT